MWRLAGILLLIGGAMAVSRSPSPSCDIPPQYWCSSEAVSKRCNVERQCEDWNNRFLKSNNDNGGRKAVNVTIYFESLCPDCQEFFLGQVTRAYKMLPPSIMSLDFVPFGNSKMSYDPNTDSYSFVCQHGPDECMGNVFETCSTYVLKDVGMQLKYILCVENRTYSGEGIKPAITECAKLDIPSSKYDTWLHCGQGHVGNALEAAMGKRTAQLSPKHTFVPWITFNGAGSETISYAAIQDLVKTVCSFYSGPGKCPPTAFGDALKLKN